MCKNAKSNRRARRIVLVGVLISILITVAIYLIGWYVAAAIILSAGILISWLVSLSVRETIRWIDVQVAAPILIFGEIGIILGLSFGPNLIWAAICISAGFLLGGLFSLVAKLDDKIRLGKTGDN